MIEKFKKLDWKVQVIVGLAAYTLHNMVILWLF